MPEQTEKRPPAGETEGQKTTQTARCLDVKITADLASRARRHDHGVLVLAERRDGIVTSQVFADLAAAERKVWRTRERGLSASLQLVRLVPVMHGDLDGLGGGGR